MTTPPSRTRSPFRSRLVTGTAAYALLATLLVAMAACADGPTSPRGDAAAVQAYQPPPSCTDWPCEFYQQEDCLVAEGIINPQNAGVTQGQNAPFEATAIGRGRSSNDLCTITAIVKFEWSVSNQSILQVGATSSNASKGYANIFGAAPGTAQVSVKMSTPGIANSTSVTKTTSLTVVAPTPAPTVGNISGPAVITAVGQYQYTVAATGGNGSYTFHWERSTDGGATWSPYATRSSGSPGVLWIGIHGGEYFKIRVRATSGTSGYGNYSPAFTIDARSAPPAAPLTASISGAQEAPSYTWCTWTAAVSGGTAPYTYSWVAVGTGLMDERISGATYSAIASHGAIELWLTVRDVMGQYVEVSRRLDVVGSGSCPSS